MIAIFPCSLKYQQCTLTQKNEIKIPGELMRFLSTALFVIATMFSISIQALVTWDPIQIITACDMSTTSCTSLSLDMTNSRDFAIQAVFSGAPVGTLKLQVSNDIGDCANATNWMDYTNTSQAVTSSGNFLWNVASGNYHCVRAVYTKTSGTGTLNAVYGRK